MLSWIQMKLQVVAEKWGFRITLMFQRYRKCRCRVGVASVSCRSRDRQPRHGFVSALSYATQACRVAQYLHISSTLSISKTLYVRNWTIVIQFLKQMSTCSMFCVRPGCHLATRHRVVYWNHDLHNSKQSTTCHIFYIIQLRARH